ncbi:hypothetical protein LCGC14_0514360 [marine sediment metagenome]|uniref:Rubredoxin-like domain-containing protein n=1 Tax=marine sediment metagenome TaxID=412755 RepID=A0A0F9SIL3_9ZZZZ
MCEGYDWWFECKECLELIFDNDSGRFPDECPECGSKPDEWKRIEAEL